MEAMEAQPKTENAGQKGPELLKPASELKPPLSSHSSHIEQETPKEVVDADPISFKLPKECAIDTAKMAKQPASDLKPPSPSQTAEQETLKEVVEAVPISFRLPEECAIYTTRMVKQSISHHNKESYMGSPQEKLASVEQLTPGTQNMSGCSTSKRFQGWTIEHVTNCMKSEKQQLPLPKVDHEMILSIQKICQHASYERLEKTIERVIKTVTKDKVERCHFSLSERLEGWFIECRQRNNNERYDMYYDHLLSHRTFRSMVEVIKFVLYEIYPVRNQSGKKRKQQDGERERKKTSTKRKRVSESFCDGTKSEEIVVECNSSEETPAPSVQKFLKDAYNNLQNFSTKTIVDHFHNDDDMTETVKESKSSEETPSPPVVEKVLEEAHNNNLPTDETAGEFLEAVHVNLMKFLNGLEELTPLSGNEEEREELRKEEKKAKTSKIKELGGEEKEKAAAPLPDLIRAKSNYNSDAANYTDIDDYTIISDFPIPWEELWGPK